ncbi:hypothetical protein HNP29_004311 [Pseudomonas alcaligenes]|nr:hypothetical protein [Pseudomonas alcaligenes]
MLTEAQFRQSIEGATEEIQRVSRALESVICPPIKAIRVRLQDLSTEGIEKLIEHVPTGYARADKEKDFIYVIELAGSVGDDMEELRAMFEAVRPCANDYSRLNPGDSYERTLYVGRSKTLRKRLREHLGVAAEGVYALHLQRWATIHEAEIEISFLEFNQVENLLVQAIEDGMWSKLRPSFGRKGDR